MRRSRTFMFLAPFASILLLAGAVIFASNGSGGPATSARARSSVELEASSEGEGEGGEMEAAILARESAMVKAEALGTAAWSRQTRVPAAPGWTSQTMLAKFNDWEPAVATDPSSSYAYILTTRYGWNRDCKLCRHSGLALYTSTDGGATWGKDWKWIYELGGWQADPQIAVDASGNVFAAILAAPYRVLFTKSTDHGATWSAPVNVIGTLPWADHEWLTVSPDGQDVYIGFNHHQNYQVTSHDGGVTWNEPVLTGDLADDDYYFAVGATILPDETVVFADAKYACCPYADFAHKKPVEMRAISSTDGGVTWTEVVVGTASTAPVCTSDRCPKAMNGGQPSIASDSTGKLLYVYSGGTTKWGPQQIWVSTSTDGGLTWTPPAAISPAGIPVAGFPQVEGTGTGDFRVAWTDNRKGSNRFNIWYRATTDGGVTWSPEVRLSNVGGGPLYKTPKGFQFFYGDYMDMAITNAGKSLVVWSESDDYWGPGNTWFALQT